MYIHNRTWQTIRRRFEDTIAGDYYSVLRTLYELSTHVTNRGQNVVRVSAYLDLASDAAG